MLKLKNCVLARQDIEKKILEAGAVYSETPIITEISENYKPQLQPASLDLRAGKRAWRVDYAFSAKPEETIEEAVKNAGGIELNGDFFTVEPDKYLVLELEEQFNLKEAEGIYCINSNKSFSGRLDNFVRLMTEKSGSSCFNKIPRNYSGKIYALIKNNSFSIGIKLGTPITQIRFVAGNPIISDEELESIHVSKPVIYNLDKSPVEKINLDNGVVHNLTFSRGIAGYIPKNNSHTLWLDRVNFYYPEDFFSELVIKNKEFIAVKDVFYILSCKEMTYIPANQCTQLAHYNESQFEGRNNYAGFGDPGFFAPYTLEARFNEPTRLFEGMPIAIESRMRLSRPVDILYGKDLSSHFQSQSRPTLSRIFKGWKK